MNNILYYNYIQSKFPKHQLLNQNVIKLGGQTNRQM
jgi:hypothetical protein